MAKVEPIFNHCDTVCYMCFMGHQSRPSFNIPARFAVSTAPIRHDIRLCRCYPLLSVPIIEPSVSVSGVIGQIVRFLHQGKQATTKVNMREHTIRKIIVNNLHHQHGHQELWNSFYGDRTITGSMEVKQVVVVGQIR
jgi:hypothetical protein